MATGMSVAARSSRLKWVSKLAFDTSRKTIAGMAK
jgi:hypothetical protein